VTFPVSDAYRKLNPMGSVPFMEDGKVAINESVAIMLYLAQNYGPTPLLPERNDPTLARVLQMTVFSEASIGGALNTLMAAHFGAPEADKKNWSVRVTEAHINNTLSYIENILGDQPYLAGANFSLADIAISTALGIRQGALGQATPPKLAAWRDKLMERPAYQRAKTRAQG
jgi:glutathione S-transferase